MHRFLSMLLLVVALTSGAATPVPVVAQSHQAERTSLWSALHRALRDTNIPAIDVYAENPSLTEVLFRSGGQTWLFSSSSQDLTRVNHAKVLPPHINAITFERSRSHEKSGFYVLWQDGEELLRIGASE